MCVFILYMHVCLFKRFQTYSGELHGKTLISISNFVHTKIQHSGGVLRQIQHLPTAHAILWPINMSLSSCCMFHHLFFMHTPDGSLTIT